MEDISGTILKGYEVRDRVAAGGFGAIYRAFQASVGREVAIKVILPHFANRPEFIRHFEAEAQLIARVEHPHIVPLYDFWREPEGAYLVMRWYAPGGLRDEIDAGRIDSLEVLKWMEQIGGALSAAHQRGVVHRDIKPENILLDRERSVYLTDFGIAKALDPGTSISKDEDTAGSPAYAAPEQALGNPISAQTDIYSLGVVLFELLTGEHPFADLAPIEQIAKHIHEPLPRLQDQAEGLPDGIDRVIQRATAKNPADRFSDPNTFLSALRAAFGESESMAGTSSPILGPVVNPFKGLRAFEEADHADFYGREALIRELISEFDEAKDLNRFIAVVGPSGSGKSSLVKAGLIPALKSGDLQGSEKWYFLEMQPGGQPIEELESGLQGLAADRIAGLRDQLQEDDLGLLRAADAMLPENSDTELFLVVDQFEEIFTSETGGAVAKHFMDLISAAVLEAESRVRVVVTIRADFYDRPLLHPSFGDLVKRRTFAVVPLSAEELASAIVSPISGAGLSMDPDLVAEIVSDVLEEPGALPMLQYAMTELFDNRSDASITTAGYRAIGGVFGALGNRSEEIFSSLEDESREIARQMFLRLVTLGEGKEDTRRRALRGEILSLWGNRAVTEAVIEEFGSSRLLSFDHDPATRDPTVEIAHEALIREWSRLRTWLDESRDDIRQQRLLNAAAKEWTESGKEPSFLLHGARLDQFETWASRAEIGISPDEIEFLDASLSERRLRHAEEAQRQEHEARLERRSRNVLRALVGVLTVAAVAGLALAGAARNAQQDAEAEAHLRASQQVLAEQERDRADEEVVARSTQQAIAVEQSVRAEIEAARAVSRELAASSLNALDRDPQLALLLALESVEKTFLDDGSVLPEAQDALHRAVQATADRLIYAMAGEDARIWRAIFDPSGTRLATYGTSGRIPPWQVGGFSRIWDVENSELLETFPGFLAVEHWFEDGRIATITEAEGSHVVLVFWDAETGEAVEVHEVDLGQAGTSAIGEEDISSALVSPDRRWFSLSWSQGGTAYHQIWDLLAEELVYSDQNESAGTTFTRDITSMAFSPDGGTLLLGESSAGQLSLFSLSDLDIHQSGAVGRGSFRDLEFSPNGQLIATASTCQEYFSLRRSSGDICARALTQALTESRIINPITLEETVPLFSHPGETWGVAFNPTSDLLAIAGRDRIIRVVEAGTGVDRYVLPGHADEATAVDFSPDGAMLVSGGWDGAIRLWDLRPDFGYELFQVDIAEESDSSGAYAFGLSPDGTVLALSNLPSAVQLWDARNGEPALQSLTLSSPLSWFGFAGNEIAVLATDGSLETWDPATEAHTILANEIRGCCFDVSKDRKLLALATEVNVIGVFEIIESSQGAAIQLDKLYEVRLNEFVTDVVISSSGSLIAVLGRDGLSRIFDATTGERLRTLDYVAANSLAVDFNPHGDRVAIGYEDGVVRIRNMEDRESVDELVGHLAAVHDVAYSLDGSLLASASDDGTVRIWDAQSGQEQLVLSVSQSGATDVAFSPDGVRLYARTGDGIVKAYLLDIEELLALARSQLTRQFTDAECVKYMHLPACSLSE